MLQFPEKEYFISLKNAMHHVYARFSYIIILKDNNICLLSILFKLNPVFLNDIYLK